MKAGEGRVPVPTLFYTGLGYTSLWQKDKLSLRLEAKLQSPQALCTAEGGSVDYLPFSNIFFSVMPTGFRMIYKWHSFEPS